MQALYSLGTYEWHEKLVAEAFKRPPADFAGMHSMVAVIASHASQTLTHNLGKEVAHLRAEARTAGGAEQVRQLEA